MKEGLQERSRLFVQNRDAIKETFGWESAYIYPLCAGILAAEGVLADGQRLRSCRDMLKRKTGVFSSFRGTSKLVTVTILSLSPEPEAQMERMLAVYSALKELFWGSEYLAVAAGAIARLAEPEQHGEIVERTRTIYNHMKAAHPFLTSGEDSPFAALLALSGMDAEAVAQEAEDCYRLLKRTFFSANAVQALSHVLALGPPPAGPKCERVTEIFESLRAGGRRYGTDYELATLGALALLDTPVNDLVEDMLAADQYLKGQRGFGAFGVGAKQRLMYAGMLAMNGHVPQAQTIQLAALNGIVSLVIAQQAAICASMAAASASAAAASSAST